MVRDRLDLLKTTIRDRLDRWGRTYDDRDPPSLAEITEQEFSDMEQQVDKNHQRGFRDPSTSSSDEDEIEMPRNDDAATNNIDTNTDMETATGTPEKQNPERDEDNQSAGEYRSAEQNRYLSRLHYQRVLERGRKNRKLILRCMRYPGTVVINRLPKQIREMTFPGSIP